MDWPIAFVIVGCVVAVAIVIVGLAAVCAFRAIVKSFHADDAAPGKKAAYRPPRSRTDWLPSEPPPQRTAGRKPR
jgi:hypothetical protein